MSSLPSATELLLAYVEQFKHGPILFGFKNLHFAKLSIEEQTNCIFNSSFIESVLSCCTIRFVLSVLPYHKSPTISLTPPPGSKSPHPRHIVFSAIVSFTSSDSSLCNIYLPTFAGRSFIIIRRHHQPPLQSPSLCNATSS